MLQKGAASTFLSPPQMLLNLLSSLRVCLLLPAKQHCSFSEWDVLTASCFGKRWASERGSWNTHFSLKSASVSQMQSVFFLCWLENPHHYCGLNSYSFWTCMETTATVSMRYWLNVTQWYRLKRASQSAMDQQWVNPGLFGTLKSCGCFENCKM